MTDAPTKKVVSTINKQSCKRQLKYNEYNIYASQLFILVYKGTGRLCSRSDSTNASILCWYSCGNNSFQTFLDFRTRQFHYLHYSILKIN